MMKTTIHCLIPERDTLRFYMTVNGESYYLFDQNFRHGVYSFYKNGVYLDQALDTTLANFDFAILNTMEKLPAYIKYIEREYDIKVLRQTIRKSERRRPLATLFRGGRVPCSC